MTAAVVASQEPLARGYRMMGPGAWLRTGLLLLFSLCCAVPALAEPARDDQAEDANTRPLLSAVADASAATLAGPPAGPLPEIWLATMAPGRQFWEVFGHNALLVITPERSIAYNFGYFDFSEPGFLSRFIAGDMQYELLALPADRDLASYRNAGRAVSLQRLNLLPDEVQRLVQHLEQHARPEARRYRYDYFLSNCSTKVRDALDFALNGALHRATRQRSHGYTHRSLALAHGRGVYWMYLGMHIGLGRVADQALSIWDEFYIPALLKQMIDELELPAADGSTRRLLAESRVDGGPVGASTLPRAVTQPPWLWPWTLLLGALVALALRTWSGHTIGKLIAWTAIATLGIGGAILAFLWLGSGHWAAAQNQNLFLFNPGYLVALIPMSAARRTQVLQALFAIGALGSFCKVFPGFYQQNIEWVFLLLPLQWALWQAWLTADHER